MGLARKKSSYLGSRRRFEDPLQDQDINMLVAKGEGEVIGKSVASIACRKRSRPVLADGCRESTFRRRSVAPYRRGDREGMHERRPPG